MGFVTPNQTRVVIFVFQQSEPGKPLESSTEEPQGPVHHIGRYASHPEHPIKATRAINQNDP